ncbi:MAG: phosphate ABC transporter substrate-binding protein PstS [Acidimicrobiales bacterium]
MRNDVGTTRANGPRRRFGRAGMMGVAAITLASTLGVGVIFATPGGATTKHPSTTHVTSHAASAPTITSLETELTALESQSVSGSGTLTEAGSSLFYPLWEEWAAAKPPVALNVAAGGSGKGQSEALNGTIDMGASDAFLPNSTLDGTPAVLNIPVVVSSQEIVYNLPGLPAKTHLKLNAKILADIYNGSITTWNAKPIASINPGVTLPDATIVPVRRSDSSGDTFLFTSYLYRGDPSSWNRPSPYEGPSLYYSTWPSVTGELAESGNTGVEAAVKATPDSIGYLGIAYLPSAVAEGIGYAALENGSGNYVTASLGSVELEVSSFKRIPADGAISLVDSKAAKHGYPDVNFEYAIVLKNQASPAVAAAIQATLAWAMDPRYGSMSTYLNPVLFKPLPTNALAVAVALVKEIS